MGLSSREQDLIMDKLAYIRDNIFDESDFVSEEGYDMVANYVGSPYEVLCGIEEKLIRQQKELEQVKKERQEAKEFIEAIEIKVQEKLDSYERGNQNLVRYHELVRFQGWLLCGDDY